jgi:hypothetical protein
MEARRIGKGIVGIVLAVIALATIVPGSAIAAGEAESNDGIHLADGPLVPGTNYDGQIGSTSDTDWWIVHVSGAGVLDLTLNNTVDTNEGCCSVSFELLDADGTSLNSRSVSENQSGTISYTTPGAGTYFVVVDANSNDRYRLTVSGPAVPGSRPAAPDETVPNNNQTPATAFGPLVGNRLYAGSIDAVTESDWFVFNTSGPGTFDVAVTNIVDTNEGCCSVSAGLYAGDGTTSLKSDGANENEVFHLTYTAGAADRFFLNVDANSSDRYTFKVNEPGGLLTDAVPPRFTQACADADAALTKAEQKFLKAKSKLAGAFTKKAKKKARAKVKKAKQSLNKAKQAFTAACGFEPELNI